MDIRPQIGNERPTWLGYIAGIVISAIVHAALFVLVFFVAPRYLHSETTELPAYTVKIVDNIPAGDLGTHLPKLSGHKRAAPKHAEPKPEQIAKAEPLPPPEPPKIEPPKEQPPPPPPPAEDKNAVSLKTAGATPTPTPPPMRIEPTPAPTPSPKTTHMARSTPRPAPQETPAPRTLPLKRRHKKAPVEIAKAEHTPSVEEQLAKIRANLLKEKLKRDQESKSDEADEADQADEGEESNSAPSKDAGDSGPVLADKNVAGSGYGVGSGTGSAGIQQDLQFLLYYRTVQQKIKNAWIFPGGSNDLTAVVTFSIGPDGALIGVKLKQSSNDPAFDDSVVRAIRRAAPFPAPPDKYRSEFAGGVNASFKLGELKSS